MRSIGFKPHIAAGVEAAASSGGALVPPVMGAGAYMMLEIINRDPAVTYLEICQAAFLPACLYYLSIFMLVHFYARKIDVESDRANSRLAEKRADESAATTVVSELAPAPAAPIISLEGRAFFGSLGGLMGFLLVGFLVAIMFCSLVLGMGLPSAVSYLLLATIIGPVFADPSLGVPILAAHLFIFYFGMMAMVTPPVALAAYATASIAYASVMQSGIAAFRFSLVGFTLPFMFVYRPALCLMGNDGGSPLVMDVVIAVAAAVIGVIALSSAMAGFLFHRLGAMSRLLLYVAASCALFPDQFGLVGDRLQLFDVIGAVLLFSVGIWNWNHPPKESENASGRPVRNTAR